MKQIEIFKTKEEMDSKYAGHIPSTVLAVTGDGYVKFSTNNVDGQFHIYNAEYTVEDPVQPTPPDVPDEPEDTDTRPYILAKVKLEALTEYLLYHWTDGHIEDVEIVDNGGKDWIYAYYESGDDSWFLNTDNIPEGYDWSDWDDTVITVKFVFNTAELVPQIWTKIFANHGDGDPQNTYDNYVNVFTPEFHNFSVLPYRSFEMNYEYYEFDEEGNPTNINKSVVLSSWDFSHCGSLDIRYGAFSNDTDFIIKTSSDNYNDFANYFGGRVGNGVTLE